MMNYYEILRLTKRVFNLIGQWRRDALFLAFMGKTGFDQYGIYLMKMDSDNSEYSFERVGHLSTVADARTRWDSKIDFTYLGRKSIIIKEGFDLDFQMSFLRLNTPPGFKTLATCRGQVGYNNPMDTLMDIAEPSSEVFLLHIPYLNCQFLCHVANRHKGEYFIISRSLGLYHQFDIIRDSQWRVQMQHGAGQTFELLLGTSQYNTDALLVTPGEVPSHQVHLESSPGTVHVKIRPRAARTDRSVQLSYCDSALDHKEPGFHLKNKLLREAFSVKCASPREYNVILEYVAYNSRW